MNNKLTLGLLLGLLLIAPACSFFKSEKKEVTVEQTTPATTEEVIVEQIEELPENPMVPQEDQELK